MKHKSTIIFSESLNFENNSLSNLLNANLFVNTEDEEQTIIFFIYFKKLGFDFFTPNRNLDVIHIGAKEIIIELFIIA